MSAPLAAPGTAAAADAPALRVVRVQTDDFDLSTEVARLRAGNSRVGAVVSFVGAVRDLNDGVDVAEMALEHYPGMTEAALERIVGQACARWPLAGAVVIHRVGPLPPTAQIVLVAVSAAHRGEAFAACEFIIDYLKTDAPFWKKEQTPDGARWVDARSSDDTAMAKWGAADAGVL
jgi:molybdopterin synthase catalytic subunit